MTELAPQPQARPQQIAAACALIGQVVETLFDVDEFKH